MRHTLKWLCPAVVVCLASGCVPLDDGFSGGGTDLSGSVRGVPFEFVSGGADAVGDGYVILLTNTTEFACGSFDPPPLDYVSISISNVETSSTYSAAGNVFFNSFEGGVSAGSPADNGTVTIDEISRFDGVIVGSVDASNANSNVFGSFDVEICF